MLNLELLGENSWRGPGSSRQAPLYQRTWIQAALALLLLGCCVLFAVWAFVILPLREKASTYDMEECKKLEAASVIYDRHGGEIGRLFVNNRTPVKLTEVPSHLLKALTSQEDSRFYEHDGVDYIGIGRAVWLTIKVGRVTQGASTLTQQLARNTFELREMSIKRKLLEAFVAQRLEKHYTKEEILELYLNRIFFGGGNRQNFYGIQAAARGYFGKDVKDLSIEESATIVGLIKAPNLYSPLRNAMASIKARNLVFNRMMEERHLTPEEADALSRKPMITVVQGNNPQLTYVYDEISQQIKRIVGEERANTGGFQIYTSIDPVLQKTAEETVQRRLIEVESRADYEHQTHAQFRKIVSDWHDKMKRGAIAPDTPKPKPTYLQGSALVINNNDGSVLALVGGRDFRDSQFNRVMHNPRPTGTAFIPFVYAQAFGSPMFFPGSKLTDEHLDNRKVMIGGFEGLLGEWGVESETTTYAGHITARDALAYSRNAATVRLAYQACPGLKDDTVDVTPIKEISKRVGILTESESQGFASSILGTANAGLDEMCLAYSCFPNGGTRPASVHLINKITDSQDKIIYQISEEQAAPVQAMDEIAAWQVNSCLQDAMTRGTGKAAREEFGLKKFPCGGKTGTGYNFKDLWFVGYTSQITGGVWVGFDTPKPIYVGAFSSRIALPIWTDIMNASLSSYKPAEFKRPEGMNPITLCQRSLLMASEFCHDKVMKSDGRFDYIPCRVQEWGRPGTYVENQCDMHMGEGIALDIQSFLTNIGRPDRGIGLNPIGVILNVEPVRMQGLGLIGSDPYNSIKPILRVQEAEEGPTNVKRAMAVEDDEKQREIIPIRLEPPTPQKLIL
jgi:membrane carboxypeptidase/penicillin-binding protein